MHLKTEAKSHIETTLGHTITEFPLDNTFHHFTAGRPGKKPLWAIGKTWEFKNKTYCMINFGNFQTGFVATYKSYDSENLSKHFVQKEKEVIQALQQEAAEQREKKNRECKEKWTPIFNRSEKSIKPHDYLVAKKLPSNYCARIDYNNVLLIPIYDINEELAGLQRIYLNPETKKYDKKFTYGVKIKGSFCPITDFDLKSEKIIYFAEGFATASTVYEAVQKPTICVFNAANLLPVIQSIRTVNPSAKFIIAADDDFQTMKQGKLYNPGMHQAFLTKKLVKNTYVIKPKFSTLRIDETDFNDLHVLEGIDIVKSQLNEINDKKEDVILLGSVDKDYYFYPMRGKKIVKFKLSEINDNALISMAPESYWAQNYASKKDEPTQCSWKKAKQIIYEKQDEVGELNIEKIRSKGTWNEQGNILVNFGKKILYQNELRDTFDHGINTDHFYQVARAEKIYKSDPLTDDEGLEFVKIFQDLPLKNEYDHFVLSGWIACAQIFGALEWRPHIWVTGERGAGKTAILNHLSELIPMSLHIQDSTAAGIRQKLENTAQAVLMDEAEPDPKKSDHIVQFIRQSSAKNNTMQLRGTAGGKSIAYNANACFCLGSIQMPRLEPQDLSRINVIELKKRNNHEKYEDIKKAFYRFADKKNSIFMRMVNNFSMLQDNIRFAKKFLEQNGFDARMADQIGTLVSAHLMLYKTTAITEEDLDMLVFASGFNENDYCEESDVDTAKACLETILDVIIDRGEDTIGGVIYKYNKNPNLKDIVLKSLAIYGMHYDLRKNEIFLPSDNNNLNEKLKNTKKTDYRNIIRRSDELFIKFGRKTVSGMQVRGMFVKLQALTNDEE